MRRQINSSEKLSLKLIEKIMARNQMRDKERTREKNKSLHKIKFQIETIICAFLHGQSNNLEFVACNEKENFAAGK